jgi:hypothetical protein
LFIGDLLNKNHESTNLSDGESALDFDGWRQLCVARAPIFVEWSPGQLCQGSAIEFFVELRKRVPDFDFLVIGSIRNLMDALYLQHKRSRPRQNISRNIGQLRIPICSSLKMSSLNIP